MPVNCPIGLITFLAPDACQGCPQYERDLDRCGWFCPRKPIVELLDTEERLARLEKHLQKPKEPEEVVTISESKDAIRQSQKSKPRFTGGIKV